MEKLKLINILEIQNIRMKLEGEELKMFDILVKICEKFVKKCDFIKFI